MADSQRVEVMLTNHGHGYTAGGTQYTIESHGSMLIGRVVDPDGTLDSYEKEVIDMAINQLTADLAKEYAKDHVKEFRKATVAGVNKAVRQYLKDNKKKLMGELVKQAIAEAEERINDVDRYYD